MTLSGEKWYYINQNQNQNILLIPRRENAFVPDVPFKNEELRIRTKHKRREIIIKNKNINK